MTKHELTKPMEKDEATLDVTTIKYIIARVIEKAKDDDIAGRDDFVMGKRLAYYEILDTIRNELVVNEQDLKEFGLDFNLEEKFLYTRA